MNELDWYRTYSWLHGFTVSREHYLNYLYSKPDHSVSSEAYRDWWAVYNGMSV